MVIFLILMVAQTLAKFGGRVEFNNKVEVKKPYQDNESAKL